MCGLVGMAGAGVTTKDLKMLQDMAYVAGLRSQIQRVFFRVTQSIEK